MHYPRSFLTAILFVVAPFCAGAEDFENGVPRILVEQFANGQISSGLPAGFPEVDLPAELNVMGSLQTDFNQVVVLNSALDSEESAMALVNSLMQEGWMELTPYNMEQPMTGFIYPNQVPSPLFSNMQYCHDGYGILSLLAPETSADMNLLKVTLMHQALTQPGFSCQQQNAQRQMQQERGRGPFGMVNAMYMPRLVLPENENQPAIMRTPFFGGFSGSSDDFETNANYRGDMEIDALYEHFASQLEEQGWSVDSQWTGDITAGGNWTISQGENLDFLGVLSITQRAAETFELKFRLITRNTNSGGAAIRGVNVIRDVVSPQ